MELTIDDCLAIAGRECATEHELRAAVCVAVGQALHYRYEARGYSDAAETAKRDADRARAEARAYSEALIAKDSAPDTSDGIDYPARAEVWQLRESVEALRARAERAEAERDAAVQEREAFSLRLSAAERERDEARAERDALREVVRAADAVRTLQFDDLWEVREYDRARAAWKDEV